MFLRGVFDTHVHFAPHAKVRANTDAITLADIAAKHEMAGFVLKDNTFPSVGAAYLAQIGHPELQIFGGIVLNPIIGGFNAEAVRAAIRYGEGTPGQYCRFVCLPTFFSKRDVEYHRRSVSPMTLVKNGAVVDELKPILELAAGYDQVLLTGHVGEDELGPVVEQARRQGVKNIVVGHPCSPVVDISLEAQRQLGQCGVIMQHCCVETYPYFEKKYGIPGPSFDQLAKAIRYAGAEHCILATDMGADSGVNPTPADGFADFLNEMENRGFTEDELKLMAVTRPLELYGGKVEQYGGRE